MAADDDPPLKPPSGQPDDAQHTAVRVSSEDEPPVRRENDYPSNRPRPAEHSKPLALKIKQEAKKHAKGLAQIFGPVAAVGEYTVERALEQKHEHKNNVLDEKKVEKATDEIHKLLYDNPAILTKREVGNLPFTEEQFILGAADITRVSAVVSLGEHASAHHIASAVESLSRMDRLQDIWENKLNKGVQASLDNYYRQAGITPPDPASESSPPAPLTDVPLLTENVMARAGKTLGHLESARADEDLGFGLSEFPLSTYIRQTQVEQYSHARTPQEEWEFRKHFIAQVARNWDHAHPDDKSLAIKFIKNHWADWDKQKDALQMRDGDSDILRGSYRPDSDAAYRQSIDAQTEILQAEQKRKEGAPEGRRLHVSRPGEYGPGMLQGMPSLHVEDAPALPEKPMGTPASKNTDPAKGF